MGISQLFYFETSDSSKLFKFTVEQYSDLSLLTDVNEGDLAFVSATTGIFGFRNLKGLYEYKSGNWAYASKDLQDKQIQQQAEIDANELEIANKLSKGGYNGTAQDLEDLILNSRNGFIDYNDTTGSFSITADTWTDLPNNGAGAFTNKDYPPNGVTELIDTATGYIDASELSLGDNILIRNDYTINPNTNNAQLRFRYQLGNGAGLYTLEKIVGRLDSGSGQGYRFSLTPDLIYMGDSNTRDNPIKLQIYCTSNATVTNAGTVITVVKR